MEEDLYLTNNKKNAKKTIEQLDKELATLNENELLEVSNNILNCPNPIIGKISNINNEVFKKLDYCVECKQLIKTKYITKKEYTADQKLKKIILKKYRNKKTTYKKFKQCPFCLLNVVYFSFYLTEKSK